MRVLDLKGGETNVPITLIETDPKGGAIMPANGYSLWLERVKVTSPEQPRGLKVNGFSFADSRSSDSYGGGYGKANFDTLSLMLEASQSLTLLVAAGHSGAPLGRGKLHVIPASGSSRVLLDFSSGVVESVTPIDPNSTPVQFLLQLRVDHIRVFP
jgi:hypothetical protein